MASLAASSSRVPCGKYDVFISFRGPDVRFGFLSHLEKSLCQKNIHVYVDDRLESGEEISSSLVQAIEGSKIALLIFSKDYASSKWCLDELVKIMECKEAHQQTVIPVFYHVDPSHVRNQESDYADAFTRLEQKFMDNVDKLQIWRSVLKKSADISGHHYSKFPNESKLIEAIVEDVQKKLEDNISTESNSHLIGLHQNFISVESLMKQPLLEEVRILGIWGMGGIGKTTLASAIFDKFKSTFESHCFLRNVREKSTQIDGLNSLRKELVSKLLKSKDDIDWNEAMRRLESKKVLIVVDDVDNPKQLKYLVVQHLHRLLGQGSRILVTSRDMHVLKSGGIADKYIHEVNVLNFEKSLELFSVHAFNQSQPKMEYQELSKMTVNIAGGLPLALEVLGSHFHSRTKEYWESELRKLKKCHPTDIQNKLRISYDGLDYINKEIFLDVAFFFVGEQADEVTRWLEGCGFEAVCGIQDLIEKALIKSNPYGSIVMHDLIREMAEQIVRENPETRSRLNDADELCGILESNKGIDKIEGIILNWGEGKCLQLEADIFKKMKNLRIIKVFVPIELPGLDSLPNTLKYLSWYDYPLEYLPSGSFLKNLVELHMVKSNVKRLWDGKQDLANLKKINLRGSSQLIELPDFSMARKLEIVDLNGCVNLRSVHPSILSLHTVVELDVEFCEKLESLESETHLESLSNLRMEGCDSLKRFCLSSKKLRDIDLLENSVEILNLTNGKCTELRTFRVNGDSLRSLQLDGLCCSINLKEFEVTNFKKVFDPEKLHSLFYAWRNLTYLCLDGWSYLREIPDSIKGLTKLEKLSLNDSGVEALPALNDLSSLKHIYLRSCKMLKSILGLPPFLEVLDAGECTSLETLPALNDLSSLKHIYLGCCKMLKSILGLPPFLEELDIGECTSLETLPALNDLSSLKHIYLRSCKMLKSILGLPPFLEELDIGECTSLETLPALNDLSSLKHISLSSFKMPKSIHGLPPFLEELYAGECTSLETLPALNDLSSLKKICLRRCKMLKSMDGLPPFLEKLVIEECTSLETLPALNDLSRLKHISLRSCKMLKSILGLPPFLEKLDAEECTSLETLPALNDLSSLKKICLRRCKMLKSIHELPPFLEKLDARECTSLETICSDHLFRNHCALNFLDCVKLNEDSHGFIEKLMMNSLMSSPYRVGYYYSFNGTICYPGSRVPEWMKYKQMTEASGAIEFTCNPKQPYSIVFCCVAPSHLISNGLSTFSCHISYGDDNTFIRRYDNYLGYKYASKSDHVLFCVKSFFDTRASNEIKFSCKFFLRYDNKSFKKELVHVEACGVHVIYYSEPKLELGQKRNRVEDIGGDDRLPPTKQLNNSGVSQPTPLCLAITKSKKSDDNFICHPLQLKFLRIMKQKEVSLLHFL